MMRKAFIWKGLLLFFLVGCRLLPSITTTTVRADSTISSAISNEMAPTKNLKSLQTQDKSELPGLSATQLFISSSTAPIFRFQPSMALYKKNFRHPEKGCNWMGVAGQILGNELDSHKNLVVVIKGKLGEQSVNAVMLTGMKGASKYGAGGYEISLADKPVESGGSLSIHLNDLDGKQLSLSVKINTYADCNRNLLIINFQILR